MHRYSLVGPRRWPAFVWSAAMFVVPLIVYLARGGH